MWIKSLLSIFSVILNYLERKEFIEAGEIKQMKKIQDKVLARVKIKIHDRLKIDSIPDDLLLPPEERKSDK